MPMKLWIFSPLFIWRVTVIHTKTNVWNVTKFYGCESVCAWDSCHENRTDSIEGKGAMYLLRKFALLVRIFVPETEITPRLRLSSCPCLYRLNWIFKSTLTWYDIRIDFLCCFELRWITPFAPVTIVSHYPPWYPWNFRIHV